MEAVIDVEPQGTGIDPGAHEGTRAQNLLLLRKAGCLLLADVC